MCTFADVYANSISLPPRATLAVGLNRCDFCNDLFPAERCSAQYCSDLCRVKAWQRRRGRAAVISGDREWQRSVIRVRTWFKITATDRRVSEAVLHG